MKFSSLIVFMSAWSLLVYSPVAHSVWYVSSNGLNDKTNGWLTPGRLYRKQMPDGEVRWNEQKHEPNKLHEDGSAALRAT